MIGTSSPRFRALLSPAAAFFLALAPAGAQIAGRDAARPTLALRGVPAFFPLSGAAELPSGPLESLPAAAAAPARAGFDVLGKLGARDRILSGGGVLVRADGFIEPVKDPIHFAVFDNDDNIAYYGTKVYLRHKVTREETALTTSEFAEFRTRIGKSGKFQDYDFFDTDKPDGGSFRDFRDVADPEIFIRDTADAMNRKGPSWFDFAAALGNPRTAPWVAILTTRGHRPENMARGFGEYERTGEVKATPRPELIFGVKSEALSSILKDVGTPERKAEVLVELLDLLESIPLQDPSARHSFGFSDDDADMIARITRRLSAEQVVGARWPHVKISLFATGPKNESVVVLSAPR